jgi:hypothetical protein
MIACPACAEQNPAKAKFCRECGVALRVVESRGEERKVVTVLFADLVGFTSRNGGRWPGQAGGRAAWSPLRRHCRRRVREAGVRAGLALAALGLLIGAASILAGARRRAPA